MKFRGGGGCHPFDPGENGLVHEEKISMVGVLRIERIWGLV